MFRVRRQHKVLKTVLVCRYASSKINDQCNLIKNLSPFSKSIEIFKKTTNKKTKKKIQNHESGNIQKEGWTIRSWFINRVDIEWCKLKAEAMDMWETTDRTNVDANWKQRPWVVGN